MNAGVTATTSDATRAPPTWHRRQLTDASHRDCSLPHTNRSRLTAVRSPTRQRGPARRGRGTPTRGRVRFTACLAAIRSPTRDRGPARRGPARRGAAAAPSPRALAASSPTRQRGPPRRGSAHRHAAASSSPRALAAIRSPTRHRGRPRLAAATPAHIDTRLQPPLPRRVGRSPTPDRAGSSAADPFIDARRPRRPWHPSGRRRGLVFVGA